MLTTVCLVTAFMLSSAFLWGLANDFNVAQSEGFDPLRYEYFARSELPEFLADSSSYSIVTVMQALYSVLPPYFGFIALVGLCMIVLLVADNRRVVRVAVVSPLVFFYIAQTGKDGLAMLAVATIGLLGLEGFRRLRTLPLLLLVGLAIFVRPTLLAALVPVFFLFRFGVKAALATAAIIVFVFTLAVDLTSSLALLQNAVADDASGPLAQAGRELSFGYSPGPTLARFVLYFFSPVIQPLAAVAKILSGADSYVIFEGCCQVVFLAIVIRKKLFIEFVKHSVPFVVLLAGTAPFYHFRYLAVIYPAILCYCLLQQRRRRTVKAGQAERLRPGAAGNAYRFA